MDYLKRAVEISPEVIANRRYLHRNPELGHNLDHTVGFVKQKLEEIGYSPIDCGDHGIIALAGGKRPGKCILLRADMDALPMREESGLEFCSRTGSAAHTCGHDTHTAMLLGAAKIFKEIEDEIPGTIKLMFQPAEEECTGAKNMLTAGVLENPHVDAAFALHISATRPSGTISYSIGPRLSSIDTFEVTIFGRGGHGSRPDHTIDPIVIGSHIVTALETINARELAPDAFGVLTFGSFHSGVKFNIIPETASLSGSLRTYDNSVREFMKQRLAEIVEGTARTYRAEATVDFSMQCGAVITDSDVTLTIVQSIAKVIGSTNITADPVPLANSDDFGYITAEIPSTYMELGACPVDYPPYPQHSPKIRFNEDALPYGVASYVSSAVGWLKSQQE